jgi:hypothetical protein
VSFRLTRADFLREVFVGLVGEPASFEGGGGGGGESEGVWLDDEFLRMGICTCCKILTGELGSVGLMQRKGGSGIRSFSPERGEPSFSFSLLVLLVFLLSLGASLDNFLLVEGEGGELGVLEREGGVGFDFFCVAGGGEGRFFIFLLMGGETELEGGEGVTERERGGRGGGKAIGEGDLRLDLFAPLCSELQGEGRGGEGSGERELGVNELLSSGRSRGGEEDRESRLDLFFLLSAKPEDGTGEGGSRRRGGGGGGGEKREEERELRVDRFEPLSPKLSLLHHTFASCNSAAVMVRVNFNGR